MTQPDGRSDRQDRAMSERESGESRPIDAADFTRSVLDALHSNVAVLDENGVIVYVNRAWLNFSTENCPAPANASATGIGVNYFEVCRAACGQYAEEAPGALSGMKAVLSGDLPSFELEYPCHSPEARRWYQMQVTPYRGKTLRGLIVNHIDITRRKLAEEALQKSEASLARAQRITHLGSWAWNLLDDRLTCSDEFFQIFGLPRQDFISFEELARVMHPDDRLRIKKEVCEAARMRLPCTLEYRIMGPGGTERMLHSVGEVISGEGDESATMFGTVQDITERKKAEEELRYSEVMHRTLIETTGTGYVILDPQGRVVEANQEYVRLTGYRCIDEIRGRYVLEWTAPDEREKNEREVRRCVENGHVRNLEISYLDRTGIRRPIEINATVIQTNNTRYIMTLCRDISERKQAEEQLKDAKEQAELYLDLMGHDINNMNQLGIGYMELLNLSATLSPADRQYVEKSLGVLRNSSKLIGDVRKMQSIKKHELKYQPIRVNDLLRDLRSEYVDVSHKGIKIDLSSSCDCTVMASGLLSDVFRNIVGNAIVHSHGPVSISINLFYAYEDGRRYCKVAFEDDGPGIPDEVKQKLFTRLQRGKTHAKGSGLGLYLSKMLVEDFGGRIWVEDRVMGDHTKGSKFVVMLPVV